MNKESPTTQIPTGAAYYVYGDAGMQLTGHTRPFSSTIGPLLLAPHMGMSDWLQGNGSITESRAFLNTAVTYPRPALAAKVRSKTIFKAGIASLVDQSQLNLNSIRITSGLLQISAMREIDRCYWARRFARWRE